MSDEFRTDIKKTDGWDMLFHTFMQKGKDEQVNYMCFYNKFTGILKVFYFCEILSNSSTSTRWQLIQNGDFAPLKMMDRPSFFSKSDEEDAINPSKSINFDNCSNGGITGLSRGWNGFEYQVSRFSNDLYMLCFN